MPVVFRCYKCSQVLKTSSTKSGTVVACPKCGAELIVPELPPKEMPAEEPPPPQSESEPEPGAFLRALVTTGPRPEATPSSPQRSGSSETRGAVPASPELSTSPTDFPVVSGPSAGLAPSLPTSPSAAVEDFPIKIEPLPIRPETSARLSAEHSALPRPRDVILPRAAVVGWSMFGLLALVLAFIAGLLAGHFVWVVKVITRAG